jgi:hypothetical protein
MAVKKNPRQSRPATNTKAMRTNHASTRGRRRSAAKNAAPDSLVNVRLTPIDIIEAVRQAFGGEIACDAAAVRDKRRDRVKAKFRYYDPSDGSPKNGLEQPWHDRTWCNPPFSDKGKKGDSERGLMGWVNKAIREARWRADEKKRYRIYMLVPLRPSSAWARELFKAADDVLLLSPRISFGRIDSPEMWDGKTDFVDHVIAAFNCSTDRLVHFGIKGLIVKGVPTIQEGIAKAQEAYERGSDKVNLSKAEQLALNPKPSRMRNKMLATSRRDSEAWARDEEAERAEALAAVAGAKARMKASAAVSRARERAEKAAGKATSKQSKSENSKRPAKNRRPSGKR